MSILQRLLLCGGLLMAGLADAQTTGTLRLLIDPGNDFQFVVDRKFRMQQRTVELVSGPHAFSFWAPQRRIVDTTITVEPGVTRDFVLHLPYSAEFTAYNKQLNAFRKQQSMKKYVPLGVTVGAAVWALTSYQKMKDAEDALAADEEAYRLTVVPALITVLKEQTIPAHNDNLVKARTQFGITCGLTVVGAGLTWWLWHRANVKRPPPFDDKEKVRFDGLAFGPAPRGGWYGGLTLTLR
ncbi:MAG TPA: hypothetical protein VHL57_00405 [Flavobacteriales bacterium]|jgi:hypothetical protein|nr:hypothetical protein [Flavobacteriales bacterium]